MQTFKVWFYSMLTVIILGFIAYVVYISNKQISSVINGLIAPIAMLFHVLIICIIVAIISATVLSVIYAIVHIYRHFHKFEISEVGQYGSVVVKHGKPVTVTPYYHTEGKEIKPPAKQLKPIEQKREIPVMQDLLTSGYLTRLLASSEMLLGFNEEDLNEHTGTIEDNRTTGIAGKSRSGKTVTIAFLIIQYVLAGGKVYLIDKAWNKSSSLYHLLLPLIQTGYIKVARKPMEIVEMVDDFTTILNDRENGNDDMEDTCILVFDEWTSFMHDKLMIKKLIAIVHRIANESAGYNAYAMVGGQNWQASQAGGNALINSIHSFFVHKIDELESKRLLSKAYAKLTSQLKVGVNYFKDTSGDTYNLVTPLTTVHDSALAVSILQGKFIAGSKVSSLYTPFSYQPAFQPYAPKLIDTVKEQKPIELNPLPVSQRGNNAHSIPNYPTQTSGNTPIRRLKEQTANLQSPYVSQPLGTSSQLSRSQYGEEVNKPTPKQVTVTPDLLSEDKQVRVTVKEQASIQSAIEQAIQEGKVKSNGKVVRTRVRDILQYDNKQYKKIETYCNAMGY